MKLDPKSKKKLVIIAVVAVLLVVAIGYVAYSFMQPRSSGNYAEDVAKPLEEALVRAGATKICETGDPGKGPSNEEPWYTAYFETSKDNSQAISLINDVSKQNGYSLIQMNEGFKGYLGDRAYFDSTKESVGYPELESGKVELMMALTNSGPLHGCVGKTIENDTNKTALTLELRLPDYK